MSEMITENTLSRFEASPLRPEKPEAGFYAFVVLPPEASAVLPRRGRTTVTGTINGRNFQTLLEPDGQKSHWLPMSEELLNVSEAPVGEPARFEIRPVQQEPEPQVPADLLVALAAAPAALATWEDTTTVARVDWIHWVVSARQAKTRAKRISTACAMLAAGKRRVCCFDSSGYYSKAFSAPKARS